MPTKVLREKQKTGSHSALGDVYMRMGSLLRYKKEKKIVAKQKIYKHLAAERNKAVASSSQSQNGYLGATAI